MENSKCIDIKKRSGCLSLLEDPDRLKSLFAQTLTTEQSICWEIDPKTLQRFSKDSYVLEFSDRFLQMDGILTTNDELKWRQHLSMLFYNAVVKDKMHVLPIYLALYNVSRLFLTYLTYLVIEILLYLFDYSMYYV